MENLTVLDFFHVKILVLKSVLKILALKNAILLFFPRQKSKKIWYKNYWTFFEEYFVVATLIIARYSNMRHSNMQRSRQVSNCSSRASYRMSNFGNGPAGRLTTDNTKMERNISSATTYSLPANFNQSARYSTFSPDDMRRTVLKIICRMKVSIFGEIFDFD